MMRSYETKYGLLEVDSDDELTPDQVDIILKQIDPDSNPIIEDDDDEQEEDE